MTRRDSDGLRGRMRLAELAALLFCGAYVVVQTALPASRLREPRMTRFGWKMYARLAEPLSFSISYADGSSERLASIQRRRPLGVVLRPEIDAARVVPAQLCDALPGARAVRIERARGAVEWRPCGR